MPEKFAGEVTDVLQDGLARCEQCGELKGRGFTPDEWHEVVNRLLAVRGDRLPTSPAAQPAVPRRGQRQDRGCPRVRPRK
jgi:hypothetical protein